MDMIHDWDGTCPECRQHVGRRAMAEALGRWVLVAALVLAGLGALAALTHA